MNKKLTEEQKKNKTMKLSVQEGSSWGVMSGAGEYYVTPYALQLGASNTQIGFLSSFVAFFGALAQVFGSKAVNKFPRKKIVLFSIISQVLIWILIAGLGFLAWKNIIPKVLPILLIAFYSTYSILGNLGSPAWFSLMGDIVPEDKRGKYFARRSRIISLISLSVSLIAALILDITKKYELIFFGFIGLFLISALARFISYFLFKKHYDPEFKPKKKTYFSFWDFVKKAPKNNYGKFSIYVACIILVTNIAGPFFAVYLLKSLNFNYLTFILVAISSTVFAVLSLPLFGKIGDRFGNKKLLIIGNILISLFAISLAFYSHPIYLIFVPQLLNGLGWAAFNLGASNFVYDGVSRDRRAICFAYLSLLQGIGILIGALLGGLFADKIPINFMNVFVFLFLISGILRGLVGIIFLPQIKEVRTIKKRNFFKFMHHSFSDGIHSIKEFVSLGFIFKKS